MNKKNKNNRKGFTLIELIAVILVLGLVLVMVYQNFFFQEKALRRQREWSEINIKGRKASTYIARELRSVGYSSSLLGGGHSFGIINGTSNGIVYSHDIDGPLGGLVDLPEDIHSMMVSGDTFYIDGDFACDGAVSLDFIYIDTTGATVATVNEVDSNGNWVLPGGSFPIERVGYTLGLYSTRAGYKDTIEYSGVVSFRNKRP
jgi:prepilin-type N-terminal cleavage/methylation domain-containing protein